LRGTGGSFRGNRMKAKILIVEDETSLRDSLAEALKQAGFESSKARDGAEGYKLIQQSAPDLVLCDWKMPVMDAPAFLKLLSAEGRLEEMPVLVLTAHGTSSNAIEAMQLGAYDFITKPFDLDDVLAKIYRTLQHTALQKEVLELRQRVAAEDKSGAEMVGISAPMIEVFKSIGRIARTESTVLITGESGTGKELVARSIHRYSARKHKPFIVINCATLSETLAESELFGYERGAFTGAQSRKFGKFESADGGTVFLDEVGELPAGLQPKLLRMLQEHTFERVGGTESLTADCRILAATNRNLRRSVGRALAAGFVFSPERPIDPTAGAS
jgi:DNA-binding NtrC family response regulator